MPNSARRWDLVEKEGGKFTSYDILVFWALLHELKKHHPENKVILEVIQNMQELIEDIYANW